MANNSNRNTPSPAGVIPDGTYDAELVAVKRFRNIYKKRVHFDFVLQGGRVDGLKITKTATLSYSRESRLAATIQGLLGRELTDKELHEGIDLFSLVGIKCKVVVLKKTTGPGPPHSNIVQVFK